MNTYVTPLAIPEARIGSYAVEHRRYPAGHVFYTAPVRAVLFGGQRREAVRFDHPTVFHALTGPTGTWMTDLPVEQSQMVDCCRGLTGHVLVAGLGLGFAVTVLARRRHVTRITVVELSPEVAELVWPHTPHRGKGELVVRCVHEFLREARRDGQRLDSALLDTWQGDGETTFFEEVLPQRRAAEHVVNGPIAAWNEDVMRGQLVLGLQHKALLLGRGRSTLPPDCDPETMLRDLCEPRGRLYTDWQVPFFRRLRDNGDFDRAAAEAARFVSELR